TPQQVPPQVWQAPLTTGHRPVLSSSVDSEREGFIAGVRQLYVDLGQVPPTETAGDDEFVKALIDGVIELRKEARGAKGFARADLIRQRLGQLGVTLEDRGNETSWRPS